MSSDYRSKPLFPDDGKSPASTAPRSTAASAMARQLSDAASSSVASSRLPPRGLSQRNSVASSAIAAAAPPPPPAAVSATRPTGTVVTASAPVNRNTTKTAAAVPAAEKNKKEEESNSASSGSSSSYDSHDADDQRRVEEIPKKVVEQKEPARKAAPASAAAAAKLSSKASEPSEEASAGEPELSVSAGTGDWVDSLDEGATASAKEAAALAKTKTTPPKPEAPVTSKPIYGTVEGRARRASECSDPSTLSKNSPPPRPVPRASGGGGGMGSGAAAAPSLSVAALTGSAPRNGGPGARANPFGGAAAAVGSPSRDTPRSMPAGCSHATPRSSAGAGLSPRTNSSARPFALRTSSPQRASVVRHQSELLRMELEKPVHRVPPQEMGRLMALPRGNDSALPTGMTRLDLAQEEDVKELFRQQYLVDPLMRKRPGKRQFYVPPQADIFGMYGIRDIPLDDEEAAAAQAAESEAGKRSNAGDDRTFAAGGGRGSAVPSKSATPSVRSAEGIRPTKKPIDIEAESDAPPSEAPSASQRSQHSQRSAPSQSSKASAPQSQRAQQQQQYQYAETEESASEAPSVSQHSQRSQPSQRSAPSHVSKGSVPPSQHNQREESDASISEAPSASQRSQRSQRSAPSQTSKASAPQSQRAQNQQQYQYAETEESVSEAPSASQRSQPSQRSAPSQASKHSAPPEPRKTSRQELLERCALRRQQRQQPQDQAQEQYDEPPQQQQQPFSDRPSTAVISEVSGYSGFGNPSASRRGQPQPEAAPSNASASASATSSRRAPNGPNQQQSSLNVFDWAGPSVPSQSASSTTRRSGRADRGEVRGSASDAPTSTTVTTKQSSRRPQPVASAGDYGNYLVEESPEDTEEDYDYAQGDEADGVPGSVSEASSSAARGHSQRSAPQRQQHPQQHPQYRSSQPRASMMSAGGTPTRVIAVATAVVAEERGGFSGDPQYTVNTSATSPPRGDGYVYDYDDDAYDVDDGEAQGEDQRRRHYGPGRRGRPATIPAAEKTNLDLSWQPTDDAEVSHNVDSGADYHPSVRQRDAIARQYAQQPDNVHQRARPESSRFTAEMQAFNSHGDHDIFGVSSRVGQLAMDAAMRQYNEQMQRQQQQQLQQQPLTVAMISNIPSQEKQPVAVPPPPPLPQQQQKPASQSASSRHHDPSISCSSSQLVNRRDEPQPYPGRIQQNNNNNNDDHNSAAYSSSHRSSRRQPQQQQQHASQEESMRSLKKPRSHVTPAPSSQPCEEDYELEAYIHDQIDHLDDDMSSIPPPLSAAPGRTPTASSAMSSVSSRPQPSVPAARRPVEGGEENWSPSHYLPYSAAPYAPERRPSQPRKGQRAPNAAGSYDSPVPRAGTVEPTTAAGDETTFVIRQVRRDGSEEAVCCFCGHCSEFESGGMLLAMSDGVASRMASPDVPVTTVTAGRMSSTRQPQRGRGSAAKNSYPVDLSPSQMIVPKDHDIFLRRPPTSADAPAPSGRRRASSACASVGKQRRPSQAYDSSQVSGAFYWT